MSYTINHQGIILSPGKFEGEQEYVVAFWDMYLEGDYDCIEEDGTVIFNLTDDDRATWPNLGKANQLFLIEDSNGFVIGGLL